MPAIDLAARVDSAIADALTQFAASLNPRMTAMPTTPAEYAAAMRAATVCINALATALAQAREDLKAAVVGSPDEEAAATELAAAVAASYVALHPVA